MNFLATLCMSALSVAKFWPFPKQRNRVQVFICQILIDVYKVLENEDLIVQWSWTYLGYAEQMEHANPDAGTKADYMAKKAELGVMLWLNGGSERGLELIEEATEWFEATPAGEGGFWAVSLFNFAGVFARLQRWDEYLMWLLRALPLREARLDKNKWELAKCYSNLCFAYQMLDRHEEAEQAGLEALRLHREGGKEDSVEAVPALLNLSEAYLRAKKTDQAQEMASRAAQLCRCDDTYLASVSDTLAEIHDARGKQDLALKVRYRAMALASQQGQCSHFLEFGAKQVKLLQRCERVEEAGQLETQLLEYKRTKHFQYQAEEKEYSCAS